MLELNKIYLGDSFKLLENVDNNCVNCIIIDPSYGDNTAYGRNHKIISGNKDESINYNILVFLYEKLKNNSTCYLFTNWKFESKIRRFIDIELNFKISGFIVMVKNNFGMGYPFRNQHEICLVLEKGNPKYYTKNFSNVYFCSHIQHTNDSHPHKKPNELIRKILLHSTKKDDLVIDTFSGTGTVAIECFKTRRNFIAMEIDDKYYQDSVRRLEKEKRIFF